MAFKLVCKSDSYRWLYTPFWLSKQLYNYCSCNNEVSDLVFNAIALC